MALISCPECGHDVSDKAISCPQCGHPINTAASTKKAAKRRPAVIIVGVIILLLIAIVFIITGHPANQITKETVNIDGLYNEEMDAGVKLGMEKAAVDAALGDPKVQGDDFLYADDLLIKYVDGVVAQMEVSYPNKQWETKGGICIDTELNTVTALLGRPDGSEPEGNWYAYQYEDIWCSIKFSKNINQVTRICIYNPALIKHEESTTNATSVAATDNRGIPGMSANAFMLVVDDSFGTPYSMKASANKNYSAYTCVSSGQKNGIAYNYSISLDSDYEIIGANVGCSSGNASETDLYYAADLYFYALAIGVCDGSDKETLVAWVEKSLLTASKEATVITVGGAIFEMYRTDNMYWIDIAKA